MAAWRTMPASRAKARTASRACRRSVPCMTGLLEKSRLSMAVGWKARCAIALRSCGSRSNSSRVSSDEVGLAALQVEREADGYDDEQQFGAQKRVDRPREGEGRAVELVADVGNTHDREQEEIDA